MSKTSERLQSFLIRQIRLVDFATSSKRKSGLRGYFTSTVESLKLYLSWSCVT